MVRRSGDDLEETVRNQSKVVRRRANLVKTISVNVLCTIAMTFITLELTPGCSTNPDRPDGILQPAETAAPNIPLSYEQKIEAFSAGETEYAGLYNTFAFKATLLNASIRDAIIGRETEFYQWDQARSSLERSKLLEKAATETQVYVSFFTPERHNDNLAETKSIWSIYLDVGGQRFNGKAVRTKQLIAELMAIFPYHNRWGTPYYLSFPVSTNVVETQPSKLTITGPLGTRSIEFPALR